MGIKPNIVHCAIYLILSCAIISCDDKGPLKPYWTYYQIQVDSIDVKDEIEQTEILDITFYYGLYSTCHHFHSFETSIDTNIFTVKLTGKQQHNVPCGAAIEYKESVLPVTGLPLGKCYIRVLQRIGEDLVDSVLVSE